MASLFAAQDAQAQWGDIITTASGYWENPLNGDHKLGQIQSSQSLMPANCKTRVIRVYQDMNTQGWLPIDPDMPGPPGFGQVYSMRRIKTYTRQFGPGDESGDSGLTNFADTWMAGEPNFPGDVYRCKVEIRDYDANGLLIGFDEEEFEIGELDDN